MRQELVKNVTDKRNVPFTLLFSSHLVLSRRECKPGIKNCFQHVFRGEIPIPNTTIEHTVIHFVNDHLSTTLCSARSKADSGEERNAHTGQIKAMCISYKTVSKSSHEYDESSQNIETLESLL